MVFQLHYTPNGKATSDRTKPYQFAEPPTLARGTRLVYTAWYDNSAGNPANPDPGKLVRWGPQTFDEMMLGYIEYYVPGRENSVTVVK